MDSNCFTYEVIFIDDGSTDDSWRVIESLKAENPCLKGVKFRRNYGKSPALHTGFTRAQGDVVITMDADLQDSPDETLPTKLFNATARMITGIHLHDFNCGLKAYRNEVVKHIEVYGDMHRDIPFLVKSAGFSRIGEKVVHHQARKYGKTKFGMSRFINGYLDLMTLWFFSKFSEKPMHFFGLLGSLMFVIGFFAAVAVGAYKLYALWHDMPYRLVTDSPYFFIALTMMILGTLLFLSGFLGELISRNAPGRNHYNIEKDIDDRLA